ncbi:MAG: tetratricopeptide repeat protein [Acidobacteria bacterium]|nr:tetratricopeptide repeat protein [Acidobacteriota bacterium]
MTNKRLSLITITITLISTMLCAQHEQHSQIPPKPATLMPGLGNLHHPVSTQNSEAQKYFNQGLTLIYAFNHEEAVRSFQRAAELDPKLAMAWWGYALAVGPNYNEPTIDPARMKAAVDAVRKAQAQLSSASDAERAYIEALSTRFTLEANPDVKKLGTDYSNAMRVVYQRFPDDLDAATLYADSLMNVQPWQLWSRDGKPLGNTEEIVSVLENVLRRAPNHIGANHLYIHSVEASRNPQRGLPSASVLGKLAPAAGHLVHMPGHIYIRTGDYAEAARVNIDAATVDRQYIKATGANGMYPAMYFSHNLHFQVENFNRTGQFSEARRAARELEANVQQHVKAMPMVEGFLPYPMFVLLRFGKWDEMLKVPEPDKSQQITTTVRHYARGVALAATGKVADAKREQQALREMVKNLPGETPFGLNPAKDVLAIAEFVLEARIHWAQGNKAAAIESFRKAVTAQDALNYDEPPGWYFPVRESLGAALLLNGNAAEAEKMFREDLEFNPRNGRSLFGLLESLKAQGKQDAVRWVENEFKAAWKNAERPLKLESLL